MLILIGSPTLSNLIFSGNRTTEIGGGLKTRGNDIALNNIVFRYNSASSGGGMATIDNSITLTNVVFDSNSASAVGEDIASSGGGLSMGRDHGYATLTNVIFRGNTVTDKKSGRGGGMNNSGGDLTLTNVVFSGNSVVATHQDLFSGNNNGGGGLYSSDSSLVSDNEDTLTLTNVTFYGNSSFGDISMQGHGLLHSHAISPVFTNVILWGNMGRSTGGSNFGNQLYNSSKPPIISHSNIQGSYGTPNLYSFNETGWDTLVGIDNGHNIDSDPLFVDADGLDNMIGTSDDNLRLDKNSPSIDTGTNTGCSGTTDPDGRQRPIDGDSNGSIVCDMGAYEAPFCTRTAIVQNNSSSGAGSLRDAIDLVCHNGLLTFNAGLSGQVIDISPDGELVISRNLTIYSSVPITVSGGNRQPRI